MEIPVDSRRYHLFILQGKLTELAVTVQDSPPSLTPKMEHRKVATISSAYDIEAMMEKYPPLTATESTMQRDILDYNFTASVEKQFDEIAEGDKQWTAILKTFYKKFHPSVENTLAAKTAHKAGERILGTDPVSGKQVSVKIGRFGPVAQIGTAEDEEKPRFAQVKKEMSIETITLEEALELFKLPRTLGEYEGTCSGAATPRRKAPSPTRSAT